MCTLTTKVLNTIRRNDLLKAGDTVFVALSGGADSVALLHILLLLCEKLSLSSVRALHVHHGIRGEYADRDEQFVRELCETLSVPLTVAHVDVPLEIQRTGESMEEAARRLRYAFFDAQTASLPNAKLATAHTASDQAETVLLRLIRGCGLKGVAGIPVSRGNIIRPLLDCTADEVRSCCKENGFEFVVDETNSDLSYARNRVRHELLPSMQRISAGAERSIVRFAQIAGEEDRFLSSLAAQLLKEATLETNVYSVEKLMSADPVIRKRALCTMAYAEYDHILRLEECLETGGTVNFPNDISAVSDGVVLRFVKHSRQKHATDEVAAVTIEVDVPVCFEGKRLIPRILSYEEYKEKSKIHKNLFDFCISYDMIESDLVLRSRQAGDTIRPFGRGCTKRVKKLLNDCHIPCEARASVPVLATADRVLLLAGICADESVAVTPCTKHVLWLETVDKTSADLL